ncbi:hypothetical protein [Enhygromyxa salina]|uniref:Leucine Rich repeats (2 copies) n=1 Tax=Enhygromyxa salina TaxID=215803 RepID=A0A2S9YNJ1_9BACT|nr:hypothetical protein [Enhygromyxa salina]PRQ06655.1 hypothetical protein ENSA7_35310 [Enhygromyxa salina]
MQSLRSLGVMSNQLSRSAMSRVLGAIPGLLRLDLRSNAQPDLEATPAHSLEQLWIDGPIAAPELELINVRFPRLRVLEIGGTPVELRAASD